MSNATFLWCFQPVTKCLGGGHTRTALEDCTTRAPPKGCVIPRRFSSDCFGAVCDGELKLGLIDVPFNLDIIYIFHFSAQARHWPMTWNVNFRTIKKMSQFCNPANGRKYFPGRWNFSKVSSPDTQIWFMSDFFMQIIWGQVNHMTFPIISLCENAEITRFAT